MSDQDDNFLDPSYLGDGVYAGFDGYHVWLHANDHANPTDRIAIQPDVWEALVRYMRRRGGVWENSINAAWRDK